MGADKAASSAGRLSLRRTPGVALRFVLPDFGSSPFPDFSSHLLLISGSGLFAESTRGLSDQSWSVSRSFVPFAGDGVSAADEIACPEFFLSRETTVYQIVDRVIFI